MTQTPVDGPYAWLRLSVSLVLTTVGCAGMYVSMVALPSYQTEFAVPRGVASLPFTLVMLGFGVGGIVVGRLVDRFGVARPLGACALLLSAVFFLAAASEHFFWFAALHVLVGALGCAAVFSPLLADVSRWFLRRRGFAIAVCASGNYVAGTLWPPVVDAIISAEGWRQAYVTLGFVSAVVMLPLILLLRRPPPMSDGPVVAGGSSGTPQTLGLTANQLTWLLGVAGVGCCVAMAMPQAHVVALSMDLGFSASHGAQMLSLMFGCGVVSRLVFGWLSDRLGGLRTLLIGSSLQCLALLMFLPAASLQTLYLVAALFGLFQGGIVPCYALIVREYFPEREAGTRTGLIVFATLVGMAFGGSASGWIFDLSGSYDAAFLHGVGWNLLNIVIIGLLVARSRQSGIAPRPSLQSNASL